MTFLADRCEYRLITDMPSMCNRIVTFSQLMVGGRFQVAQHSVGIYTQAREEARIFFAVTG